MVSRLSLVKAANFVTQLYRRFLMKMTNSRRAVFSSFCVVALLLRPRLS
jgi:hypothetical protein